MNFNGRFVLGISAGTTKQSDPTRHRTGLSALLFTRRFESCSAHHFP